MDALKYFQEKARMTKADEKGNCTISCAHCPLFSHNHDEVSDSICGCFELTYPEEAIAIVQKWAEEHPVKTLLQDFQEKYPDFDKDAVGNPRICPAWLGYKNYCCDSKKATYNQCTECWNQPVKEG